MSMTRENFAGLTHGEVVLWYGLIVVSTATFCWGVAVLIGKYRRGRPERPTRLGSRILRMLGTVLSQATVRRRDGVAGLAHTMIFYGFATLFLGTTVLAIQTDITEPIFGYRFWQGTFYAVYKLLLDVGGLLLLIGLLVMAVRRGLVRPRRLDYRRPDRTPAEYDRRSLVIGDWSFLSSLVFLVVTGFLLEGVRLAPGGVAGGGWSPVGSLVGRGLRAVGVTAATGAFHHGLWWIHGIAALTFVASIPFTKALHILAAPATLALREPGTALPAPPTDAPADQAGWASIIDVPMRHLVSLDACTRCGKCHEVCPAGNSGFPLSPRDLILDLRDHAEGALGVRRSLGVAPLYEPPVLGHPIRAETLWSCMQCRACVEICPVGIDHVTIINQMRQQLVERGEMPQSLQSTLETVHTSGNSFGEPARKRSRWTSSLDFEIKDIRTSPAQFLWFVGDYASYDPRNQAASRALATILHRAGVDVGILRAAERTSGYDVRRAGEEGLFTSLAEANITAIAKCRFERILTSDPHSFHALKNEYPALGGAWPVVHHSQLLLELIESGRLPLRRLDYDVTYHDPCTLGRFNRVYDPPRRVLEAIGVRLHEMPRNRDNSLCCGAGGGRIWMTDPPGVARPSEQRIEEALSLGRLDYFVVACPKDVTMYEDAIKTSGHEGDIQLRELSELVLEALQPSTAAHPTATSTRS